MAGPLTIQRVPRGLLDLLSLKGAGQLPTDLGDRISGTIELGDLYLQDRVQTGAFTTGVLAAIGDAAALLSSVPAGELWVAYHLAIGATIGVGASYTLRPAIFRRTGSVIGTYAPNNGSWTAGQRCAIGWDLRPALLWPGDNFGCCVEAVTAGNTNFNVYLYYARLTI